MIVNCNIKSLFEIFEQTFLLSIYNIKQIYSISLCNINKIIVNYYFIKFFSDSHFIIGCKNLDIPLLLLERVI